MQYRIVVTDLDGTLLNDKKEISGEDVNMLKKLHESGIEIIIATGRNFYMAKNLVEKLKEISPIIFANNGAAVRKLGSEEIIDSSYLDAETFEKIYEYGLLHNLYPVLHVDEYLNGFDLIYGDENLSEPSREYVSKFGPRAKFIKFKPNEIKNILSACYLGDYDSLKAFIRETKGINNIFNSVCNRNIINKMALLEFLNSEGCKWKALKKYMDLKNINADEVIAFGDDDNDVELLKSSGLGIAMKNGTEICRNAAKKISHYDNNNSGVSYELSKLFRF
jgi:Cof subfamily protein (haloacid dehalogenase superfamily)